tara:strand:+ start:88 stop:585 length:498 start_codon:yes stop_codon:yes gene_type:complete
MKKALLLLFPLIIFISCGDNEDEEVSSFVGTWNLTFMGEYENADCTGDLDSSSWALVQAFGMDASITFNEDGTAEVSISVFGNTETETGTWSESSDGSLMLDGVEDEEGVLSVDGNTISLKDPSDAYCEDEDGEELPQYTDQSSCENAGNDWYEASCTLSEYTKQ